MAKNGVKCWKNVFRLIDITIDIIFFSINWKNYFDRSILVISMTVLVEASSVWVSVVHMVVEASSVCVSVEHMVFEASVASSCAILASRFLIFLLKSTFSPSVLICLNWSSDTNPVKLPDDKICREFNPLSFASFCSMRHCSASGPPCRWPSWSTAPQIQLSFFLRKNADSDISHLVTLFHLQRLFSQL